jgi:hypothetical protein
MAAPSADTTAGGSPSAAVACPEETSDINSIIAMDPSARLNCLGGRPITLPAYIPFQEHVCGDTGIEPSWLGACAEIVDLHGEANDFSADLPARMHPSTGLQAVRLKQRIWVQVTGHFDDPAALTCHQTPPPGVVAQPAEATILDCRRQFVITELHEIAAP